ncbi:NAD(+)/NADH kinase [Fimbriiglobus ruber]|uniref:NAD kinase n=1 Tax=Fimbriiglobus ruber TaxID=1908690 RepID=A0A225D384_9BACT|nr:NAD(+)/NADH kinase [Fimbriiglobus ruber]OWK36051.1 NAD kinase [Fimbriiglobus ruber]
MPRPKKRVAIYAGSFDPPGAHHRRIAAALAARFDEVIVFPSGPRPDRPSADSLPIHRAVMADLNFRGLPRVRVELSDLERNRFSPNHEFEILFGGPDVELSHVVPAAAVAGGVDAAKVRTEWEDGEGLWASAHFTILHEPDESPDPAALPPRHETLEIPAHTPSAQIRSRLFDAEAVDELLYQDVAAYIRRHGLFRPTPPARECIHRIPNPKLRLFYDPKHPETVAVADRLRKYESPDPDMIVSIGGDGTMLRAIRQHWRDRLPFYGLNTGHLGFLLNDADGIDFWNRDLRLYQLPLLWVETVGEDGDRRGSLVFNDCWVERETGQTAWVEVSVNGHVRMPRMVADGVLVSTAAGSTSYARAMGATPLPFNAPLLTLAGSNVLKPEFWHPAVLTIDSTVTVRNLDPNKRPLQGFVDGVDVGRVQEMTVRVSNIAAVELLFTRAHDPVAKLAVLQFPQPG